MSRNDVIVVGAGSAGCIVANHLAELHGMNVTLVESESAPSSEADRIRPCRWLHLLGSPCDWDFATNPSSGLANRLLRWPRGRGLGGSTLLNAMIWFPPTRSDFEHLVAKASHQKWTFEQLQSSYQQIRSIVQPESPRWLSESSQRFLGTSSHAMVYERMNRQGRRWTPADLLQHPRITILRGTVGKIEFDRERAIGVRLLHGDLITATKGVVLCAGSIATPTILMRSGIGARELLRKHDIALRVDAPEAGRCLQDHLVMPVIFGVPEHHRFGSLPGLRELLRWQTLGNGPVASNIAECGGLFLQDKLQVHVTPTHYLSFPNRDAPPAMSIAVNVTKPKSRGHVQISDAQTESRPLIEPNYLFDDDDLKATIEGVRLARQFAQSAPLSGYVKTELVPGIKRTTDEQIARSITRYAQTLYHPVGTCGLSRVVDSEFNVRGTESLSIVDSSILPEISVGNPNALIMTLAHFYCSELRR